MADKGEAPRQPGEPDDRIGPVRTIGIALGFALAIVFGWRACRGAGGDPPPAPSAAPGAYDPGEPPPAPAASAAAPAAARCAEPTGEGFVIGEAPPPPRTPDADAGATPTSPTPEPEGDDEELAPFAVRIGRGVAFDGGFAVGALREGEGGTVATLVTLGLDGKGGRTVRLARSRGDMDPPVIAAAGASVIVGMVEPNAGGRALKIASVAGEQVTWGAEIAQGRDDSAVADLAVGGGRGIAVWDDIGRDGKRSHVFLATFDAATLRSVTAARPVSPPKIDAEAPRAIARPGGFWLAYMVTSAVKTAAPDGGLDEAAGEALPAAWIEALPLDENGSPVAASRRVTPKDGHVVSFDIELGDEGGAVVTWREDDTPGGLEGGAVSGALVALGGIGEPRVLAAEGVGPGTPDLLPGWIAIPGPNGIKKLAPITGRGELGGAPASEPAMGPGEPVAAGPGGTVLVGRPAGKAMRLVVLRCGANGDAGAP